MPQHYVDQLKVFLTCTSTPECQAQSLRFSRVTEEQFATNRFEYCTYLLKNHSLFLGGEQESDLS